jgi:hypothetical protein
MNGQFTITYGPSAPDMVFIKNGEGKLFLGIFHGEDEPEWNRISKPDAYDLARKICQYLNDSAA